MTRTDKSGEDFPASIAWLKATNERLRERNNELLDRIDDLREDLALSFFVEPYDMPAHVAEVLINQLAGWPAKRWHELAALIEAYVVRSMPLPLPPTSSTAERRAQP